MEPHSFSALLACGENKPVLLMQRSRDVPQKSPSAMMFERTSSKQPSSTSDRGPETPYMAVFMPRDKCSVTIGGTTACDEVVWATRLLPDLQQPGRLLYTVTDRRSSRLGLIVA